MAKDWLKLINSASEAVLHSEQQSIPSQMAGYGKERTQKTKIQWNRNRRKKGEEEEGKTGVRDTLSVYHHLYFMWQWYIWNDVNMPNAIASIQWNIVQYIWAKYNALFVECLH